MACARRLAAAFFWLCAPSLRQSRAEAASAPGFIPPASIPAATEKAGEPPGGPWIVRQMIRPTGRGISIRLPVMDTDPNRGLTGGVMPIWVLRVKDGERIEQIHAPSLTYNRNFGPTPTYRLYYYPSQDASVLARASVAKYEKEVMGQYEDLRFMGTRVDVFARVHYNVDAGYRFYGLGPDSPESREANYKGDSWLVRLGGGVPLYPGTLWKAHLTDRYLTTKVSDGPLPGLPGFSATFPRDATATHQQTNEMRLTIDYDQRDHPVTTSRGFFFQTYAEYAVRGFLSSYDYSRYGLDGRYFRPWEGKDTATAARLKYEQLRGDAPFFLKPSLGGKYNLRAYGAGRYVDRGMAVASVEQRFIVHREKMAGVTAELEVAPFIELGSVFDLPKRASRRYARPAYGAAVRAVARPQVVGSVDIGVGQEGVSVFMDINYSF